MTAETEYPDFDVLAALGDRLSPRTLKSARQ
jgi:hypothetical protein